MGDAADAGEAADFTDAADAGLFWVARDRADGAVVALFADGDVAALSVGPALGIGSALGVGSALSVGPVAGPAAGEAEFVAAGDGVGESAAATLNPPTTVRPMAPVMAQAAVEREIFMLVPLVGVRHYKTGQR